MERFLREYFGIEERDETVPANEEIEQALAQAEGAVDQVLDRGHPVELGPRDRYVRGLQHEVVHNAGLTSESKGEEPYRRVVVYPS
jgi:predicted RNA-binding protein Jag